MLKKILTGIFALIMVGAVVAGAIAVFWPSTGAHAGTGAGEAVALRQGQGAGGQGQAVTSSQSAGRQRQGAGRQGQSLSSNQSENGQVAGRQGQGLDSSQTESGQAAGGQGQGFGRSGEQAEGQAQSLAPNRSRELDPESVALEQETFQGTVVETEELLIETESGESVQVGLGPNFYRESAGFALQSGENVRVSGFWEDGEFKATQIESLDTGASIVLRDASGRPLWAGQGRGRTRSS
jgi:hypothetical protein